LSVLYICFFFQAEDGIRDLIVTGVQTCALPICRGAEVMPPSQVDIPLRRLVAASRLVLRFLVSEVHAVRAREREANAGLVVAKRSEERRVGKEWRSRGWPDGDKDEARRVGLIVR